jgi:transcription initiation factor TFIID subunit 3
MTADLHTALLRPAVLQILRATGFNYAKPAVVDTVTDLAARYLLLLASSTAQTAFNTHNDFEPTVQDVRLALTEVGALFPQMSTAEEGLKDPVEIAPGEIVPFEDLRGVQGFVDWAHGNVNREIRRIAGFGAEVEMNVEQIAAGTDEKVDYLNGKSQLGFPLLRNSKQLQDSYIVAGDRQGKSSVSERAEVKCN